MMQRKSKFKWILSLVLVVALLAGGSVGVFALSYQSEAVVNDLTEAVNQPGSGEGEGGDGDEATAILSPNVKLFTDSEAAAINSAISQLKITNMGLYMDVASGTPLEQLGIGDIFYLDGSEQTPLGETYIGKIVNISGTGASRTYQLETPTVDEVFDVLDFDYEQVLTAENISEIQTLEGVSVTQTSDLATEFGDSPSAQYLAGGGDDNALVFNIEVDLLEKFGLKKPAEFFEEYDPLEGSSVTVYITKTGDCYHRDSCMCLSRSKFELTLSEAIDEGYDPCYLCNPPVFDKNFEPSITLEGKVGLESIDFNIDFDWDILSGKGLEEFVISANGNFVAEASLKASMKYELSGRTTEVKLPMDSVKLQGLKEKLFPIAFVGYNGTVVTSVMGGNQAIRTLTSAVPLTLGVIIYADIDGNISTSARAFFNYSKEFSYKCEVVKNGEWVWNSEIDSDDGKITAGIDIEISGDVDACIGGSVSVYVFNLNVAELAIVKIGGEAEGKIKLEFSNQTLGEESENDVFTGSYHMRLYCKLLELNIKIKMKFDLWVTEGSVNASYSRTFKDITIAEWGSKNSTRYRPGLMSYSAVTASDEDAVYYKSLDGQLIKESDGYKTVLYDQGFFSICGIDNSYLYILKPNDNGVYDLYRVSKEDGIDKKLIDDVANCLTIDEENIYYISKFDSTTINRFDRDTSKDDQFASFSDDVTFMRGLDDGFYVVVDENGWLSWLFGGGYHYYLLNSSGEIASDYGTDPEVEEYYLNDKGDYIYASAMASGGYLRDTATEVRWLSKDKRQSILTEQVSGWNASSAGIFTTLYSSGGEKPYQIVLYRAADGVRVDVVQVESEDAFFTLCQSASGDWYFFDQTDSELILYTMASDFSQLRVVKTFSLDQISYSLSDCSMKIMNNRIYFYTMPDSKTSIMLYRYDLV